MMLMRRMELLKERYLDETGDWDSSLSGFLPAGKLDRLPSLQCSSAHCWEAQSTAGLPVPSLPSLPPAPTSSSSSKSPPTSSSTSTWEAQCTVGLAGPLSAQSSTCPNFILILNVIPILNLNIILNVNINLNLGSSVHCRSCWPSLPLPSLPNNTCLNLILNFNLVFNVVLLK